MLQSSLTKPVLWQIGEKGYVFSDFISKRRYGVNGIEDLAVSTQKRVLYKELADLANRCIQAGVKEVGRTNLFVLAEETATWMPRQIKMTSHVERLNPETVKIFVDIFNIDLVEGEELSVRVTIPNLRLGSAHQHVVLLPQQTETLEFELKTPAMHEDMEVFVKAIGKLDEYLKTFELEKYPSQEALDILAEI